MFVQLALNWSLNIHSIAQVNWWKVSIPIIADFMNFQSTFQLILETAMNELCVLKLFSFICKLSVKAPQSSISLKLLGFIQRLPYGNFGGSWKFVWVSNVCPLAMLTDKFFLTSNSLIQQKKIIKNKTTRQCWLHGAFSSENVPKIYVKVWLRKVNSNRWNVRLRCVASN